MKNSKYPLWFITTFAVFILSAAFYILFIYKTDFLKIYVVYYKPAPLVKTEIFEPIQAGRTIEREPSRKGIFTEEEINWLENNMIGDNTGDNISPLNRYFAENTALYWIWKNTDSPYVGMCHYRRFLSLNDNTHYPLITYPSMRFRHLGIKHLYKYAKEFLHDLELEKKYIMPWFATHDILVAEPLKTNVYEQYKKEHVISDLDKALEIIRQKYPHMYDFAIEYVHSDTGVYPSNLFITRREFLNSYAPWLFSILLPLYDDIKDEIINRDIEQKLGFAYLSERLFTIYIKYHQKFNGLRVKEFPYALASNFFTAPIGSSVLEIKTPEWEDTFVDQKDGRLCSFNNSFHHCGKFTFLPNNILQIDWEEGGSSYFNHVEKNIFRLE